MNALRTLVWTLIGYLATPAGTMEQDVSLTKVATLPTGTIQHHTRAITTGKCKSYRAVKRTRIAELASTQEGARGNNQINQAANTSYTGRNRQLIGPLGLNYYSH